MGIKIVKEWSDQDTQVAALYDDGCRLAMDEKSAVLIDRNGTLVQQWWKQEPDGDHYRAFLESDHAAVLPWSETLSEAMFNAGHYSTATEHQLVGCRKLMELLV